MRQLGTVDSATDAQRLTAYLITQNIEARSDEEDGIWAIWVIEENDLVRAREEYQRFRDEPNHSRYQEAETKAQAILKERVERQKESQKNVIEMRGRWKSPMPGGAGMGGGGGRPPLVSTIILLCVILALVTNFGQPRPTAKLGTAAKRALMFSTMEDFVEAQADPLASVKQGEVWRLITPIFLHLGIMHLVFNMYMFYIFGRQIEFIKGTAFLGLLIVLTAAFSNVAQATFPVEIGQMELPLGLQGSWRFGGMSGVVYGLFGYIWMRSRHDPASGFFMPQTTVVILVVWLFICLLPTMNVANIAHFAGLMSGVVLGYLPVLRGR